ncbi:MAG: hypothetical protein AVDCRST_MAG89-3947, partial [uncultured Gemmatimonadetes bacterium]
HLRKGDGVVRHGLRHEPPRGEAGRDPVLHHRLAPRHHHHRHAVPVRLRPRRHPGLLRQAALHPPYREPRGGPAVQGSRRRNLHVRDHPSADV